jgi:hypothetical protein
VLVRATFSLDPSLATRDLFSLLPPQVLEELALLIGSPQLLVNPGSLRIGRVILHG